MRSSTRVFLGVLVPLAGVYALTAQWTLPYHMDAITNAISGWYLGNEGTPIASQNQVLADEQPANLAWFVQSDDGPVGQYPPGAASVVGLAYLLAPYDGMRARTLVGSNFVDAEPVTTPLPPLWPATLAAVLTTAAAAAVLALVFLEWSDPSTATLGGLVFGTATGAWSVASSMAWTHGPAMLAVALGLLAIQRSRWLLSGLAFGFAVLCRPHLALVAATIGVLVAWRRRTWTPLVDIGGGSLVGMAMLIAYNAALFHRVTVSGGYGSGFEEQFAGASLGWFASNVARGLVDPVHGLLLWAPFLLVLIPGVVLARGRTPDWAVAAAMGGVVYLLVQWRANRFTGGEGYIGYRYPLEALTAAAPALFLGYIRWVRDREWPSKLLVLCVGVGVTGQVSAIIT